MGCFREASYPLHKGDLVSLVRQERQTPRPWTSNTARNLGCLLPSSDIAPLVTEDLLDAKGQPTDVPGHYHVHPERLDQVLYNYSGLYCSAAATGPNQTKESISFAWPGYEEIWLPIRPGLSLCGELGWATNNGAVIDSDCIVILPGLLGNNNARRTKDLADALRSHGIHILAIELRGHGKTERCYPDVHYTFGVLETGDLLAVSEWLQDQPHIRRTGLVGFCWGANEALLTAWHDGRLPDEPIIPSRVVPHLRAQTGKRHFEAGVLAFSPVLRFEEIIEAMKTPYTTLQHPVLASLEESVRTRMDLKGYPDACGSLRALIDDEFARSELSYPGSSEDAMDYNRFLPFRGREDGYKLAHARVPVLIVSAANDPLTPAQAVADLIARTPNPNVAALVLAGGGHVGFAPYARAFYFNLILNFFDAQKGPMVVDARETEPTAISRENRPRLGSMDSE